MQRTHSRRQLLTGLAGGTMLGVAGCLSSDEANAEKTVALHSSPTGGNWGTYGDVTPYYTPIHETLTASSHDFSTIEPWLATDWEAVDDLTWEFTLREDVQFHDGTELTSELVAQSLSALLADRPLGWAKVTEDSFTALDDRTLQVETVERFGALAGTLSHPLFGIQHPDEDDRPIGTGPFEAPTVELGDPLRTVAFDDYWGEEPQLEELTFEGILDPTTRSLNLQAGDIDASFEIPRQDYDLLDANDDIVVRTRQEPRTGLAMMNLYNSPTDDADLRRALNYATDQAAIVDAILDGIGEPAKGPYSPMIPWSAHDDLPTYGPDMDRARELVASSGYDGETLEIHVSSESQHEQLIAARMQDNFEAVGVSTTIRQFESASFYDVEQKRESNLTIIELGSINGAADYLLYLQFHSEGGDNAELYEGEGTGLYNLGPEVDELIERGDRALDEATKHDAYREVQRRVMDAAVLVPIYHKEYVFGQRTETTGPEMHAVPHMTRWTEFAEDA
ncbi:ABC transporter substrate-binding protein [Natronoglomus mannanivorans]|uniref:ABC transporter substrate-binding protein n=1 Tax=Natronoglomus mannanivorans TaxID=2979990 RepID=A0AAP2Z0A1_9EURY|nr:ABC transporter substrate-binding protein [Halobacteria archaeon AArc-xg1-1]